MRPDRSEAGQRQSQVSDRPYNFEFLLSQLPGDDPRLRETLVNAWYRFLRSIAYALVYDPDQAEYALFETFKLAWSRLDRYPTGTDFSSWISKLCIRSCRSRLKTANQKISGMANRWDEETNILKIALDELPADIRIPTVLYLLQGFDIGQTAEITGARENGTLNHLMSGIDLLLGVPDSGDRRDPHRIARATLIQSKTQTQESIEAAETHLAGCRTCQSYRDGLVELKDNLRAKFTGPLAKDEENIQLILNFLSLNEPSKLKFRRINRMGLEVVWITIAISIFLVLGLAYNRINPFTDLRLARNNSERNARTKPIEEIAQTILTVPAEDDRPPGFLSDDAHSEATWDPDISQDGRWITFASSIQRLVTGDNNLAEDVFVMDRLTGNIERASVTSEGVEANNASYEPTISGDGRFIVFSSWGNNLSPGDSRVCDILGLMSSCPDIFLHDRLTRETTLISENPAGRPVDSYSISPQISEDGQRIVFWSAASDLTPDEQKNCLSPNQNDPGVRVPGVRPSGSDTSILSVTNCLDIFIYDRPTGTFKRIWIGRDPEAINFIINSEFKIGENNRLLLVTLHREDAVATTLKMKNEQDIYLIDISNGSMTPVNVAADGTPGNAPSFDSSISEDGRYIAFSSLASNLVAGDHNDKIDVFVLDRESGQIKRISVRSDGQESGRESGVPPDIGWAGNSVDISANGEWVVYTSTSTDLVDQPQYTCVASEICQYVYLTNQFTGETRQINRTNVDFLPVANISGDGGFAVFMANSPSCSPPDYCNDPYLYDRQTDRTVLLNNYGVLRGKYGLVPSTVDDSITFFLHDNAVTSLAFSPDGRMAVSGSRDGNLKLFYVKDGEEIGTLVANAKSVNSVAYSPAGNSVAEAVQDSKVYIWRLPHQNLIAVLPGFKDVQSVTYSPDGKTLAIGGENTVWLWDLQDGVVVSTLEVPDTDVRDLDFSPDGKYLAAATYDHTTWVWNLPQNRLIFRLGGHSDRVNDVEFSPDGRFLGTASNDHRANIWQIYQTGEGEIGLQLRYTMELRDWATSLSFSKDSRWLVTGSFDSSVILWDLEKGLLVDSLLENRQNQVFSVDFSPVSSQLIAGTVSGEVYYWDEVIPSTE